jgi:predicted metalloprotease with PDZ domain
VPDGVTRLEVRFQFLSATAPDQGRRVVTPVMLNLQWWDMLLYPAGYYTRNIAVTPTVILPEGWHPATALRLEHQEGNHFVYHPTDVETLVDSPMFAGRHYRVESLGHRVTMHMVADEPGELEATEEQLDRHRALVEQTLKLFGGEHYGDYAFLVAISDELGGIGLEHQSSSENQVDTGYFTAEEDALFDRDLLSHELVHSWNGKYRRPAGHWTPDFRTPMRDELLWLYEGQTQYWGYVLATRAGLLSPEEFREMLANTAATYAYRRGRIWRPLADTTFDPIINARRPLGWRNWQRAEDYYSEGLLIWLDADTLIRQETGGAKSLDDFARAFFGCHDGDLGQLLYTFDDIVVTLDEVHPMDWATWLRQRVEEVRPDAPLDGITRGGYELNFTDEAPADFTIAESKWGNANFYYSIGLHLKPDGKIRSIIWDSPAFDAGLAVGQMVVAVNDRAYGHKHLRAQLDAKTSPLRLLIQSGDLFRTVEIDYDEGQRYPVLERTAEDEASLDAIIAPRP